MGRRPFVYLALLLVTGAANVTPAGAQSFTQYGVAGTPFDITAGSDGNVWFTEFTGNQIGMITPLGTISEFPVPTSGSGPLGVAAGPDGNLWFVEFYGNKIGRVTTAGSITEFTIPTANSQPHDIVAGPDGNLWFTEYNADKIGRVTPTGVFTEYVVPTGGHPFDITLGSDGNLWFTGSNTNTIGKVTIAGTFTEYTLPTGYAYDITGGPDGNLWFTQFSDNRIGNLTTTGIFTQYVVPTPGEPDNITTGPDGNLWFTEKGANKIVRVTPTGIFTEYAVPSGAPHKITTGPDGNLWFTEDGDNSVWRFIPPLTVTPTPTATPTASTTATPTVSTTATATTTPTATSTETPTPTPVETATQLPTVTATPTAVALCDLGPGTGCRMPIAPRRSAIVLKDRLPDKRDLLNWKWTRGEATLVEDFGDPLTITKYAICIYDEVGGVPILRLAADIPPGDTCAGRPCWKTTTHGFKYADKDATPDGIVSLTLKEGVHGVAQIALKGLGVDLQMPSLPLDQDSSAIVELKNDQGICWSARYSAPAIENKQIEFRDKSD